MHNIMHGQSHHIGALSLHKNRVDSINSLTTILFGLAGEDTKGGTEWFMMVNMCVAIALVSFVLSRMYSKHLFTSDTPKLFAKSQTKLCFQRFLSIGHWHFLSLV